MWDSSHKMGDWGNLASCSPPELQTPFGGLRALSPMIYTDKANDIGSNPMSPIFPIFTHLESFWKVSSHNCKRYWKSSPVYRIAYYFLTVMRTVSELPESTRYGF